MPRHALALLLLCTTALTACTGDDEAPEVVATAQAETPEAEAPPTPAATATSAPTATPRATSSPEPIAEALPPGLKLTGVFSEQEGKRGRLR